MRGRKFESIESNKSITHFNINYIDNIKDVDELCEITKREFIDEYMEYNIQNNKNLSKIKLFLNKKYVSKNILEKYSYILEASNFDLI